MSKAAAELVFIPSPGIGHLVSTVELVKMLVDRDECLSVMVLVMNLMPEDNNSTLKPFTDSFKATSSAVTRIRFIELPPPTSESFTDTGKGLFLSLLSSIDSQKPHVREAVSQRISGDPQPPQLAGFVVDMFCVAMIDIANEFGVPSYVFYTSSVSFLGANYHLLDLEKQHGKPISQIISSDDSLIDFPGFVNRLPAKQLPRESRDPYISPYFLGLKKRYQMETKGILVNSFMELESRVMRTVFDDMPPPVYLVGPVLSLKGGGDGDGGNDIVNWLDQQPPTSVVFLCFGSRGAFDVEQVREIAVALERSGVRFLWSLRRPPPTGEFDMPTEYATLSEALPEGFLERTASVGKVIGWAPQTQVLAHPAVGAFVTHCGWNSTLESIWFGVPTGAWPVYAEQQFNAFETVMELGTAVEVKMDYRSDGSSTVGAEKIEGAIRQLMEGECKEKKRVKQLSESSRKALEVDGSSYKDLGRFISDVFDNVA